MKKLIAALTVALCSVLVVPPVQAHHEPNSGCSESGDVCLTTNKVDGIRKLRIGLAAQYFSQYKLCVEAPDESKVCKVFEIEDTGAGYGDSVRWARQFPRKGPGAYTVRWRQGGSLLGTRGFHVKPPNVCCSN
jgi:hypothetical protein